jgi:hypothetical protein
LVDLNWHETNLDLRLAGLEDPPLLTVKWQSMLYFMITSRSIRKKVPVRLII